MKILVIFTGGTIGSTVKKGWVGTDDSTKYALLNNPEIADSCIEFITSSPYTVLSENVSSTELNILQHEIINNLNKGFDGIIVTHGTDTLQYAATAAEYAVSGCDLPVVFVSSDYPLEDDRTNGFINFKAAVEFIAAKVGKGVFVSYKNSCDTSVHIHIASHILQHCECNADIYSIEGFPYAIYDGKIKPTPNVVFEHSHGLGAITYSQDSQILLIDSHPGDSYSYSLHGVKAIIIKPYHSATLNTSSQYLQDFCHRATADNIPVFVVNIQPGISYESAKLFEELNIIPMPYSTFISAYMKVWAGLSLGTDIKKFVQKPIANEMVYVK